MCQLFIYPKNSHFNYNRYIRFGDKSDFPPCNQQLISYPLYQFTRLVKCASNVQTVSPVLVEIH